MFSYTRENFTFNREPIFQCKKLKLFGENLVKFGIAPKIEGAQTFQKVTNTSLCNSL